MAPWRGAGGWGIVVEAVELPVSRAPGGTAFSLAERSTCFGRRDPTPPIYSLSG